MLTEGCVPIVLAVAASSWLASRAAAQDAAHPQEPALVLTLHLAGREALLTDARDAELRRVLGRLDDLLLGRGRKQESEHRELTPGELAFELLSLPLDLRLTLAQAGSTAQLRAQLECRAASAAEATALARRFATLAGPLLGVASAAEPRGFRAFELPSGTLHSGARDAAFVLAFGPPERALPPAGSFGLPAGATPLLGLSLELGSGLEALLAAPGPDAELRSAVRAGLAAVGCLGEGPLGVRLALGQDARHLQLGARVRDWAHASGGGVTTPLTAAELRLVPRDARVAALLKVDLAERRRALPSASAPLAAALGAGGLESLLEPLGTTVGFYLADSSEGSDLAGAVLFASVDDEPGLQRALAAACAALAGDAAAPRVQVRAFEHAGVSCRSLALPGAPARSAPSFALARGVLFLGATPQALADALDQASVEAPGLSASEPLRAELAGSLDDLVGLGFVDTAGLLEVGYPLAGPLCSALAKLVNEGKGRRTERALPTLQRLTDGARALVLTSRREGDDLVLEGHCASSAVVNLTAWIGVAALGWDALDGLLVKPVAPRAAASLDESKTAKAKADIASLSAAVTEYAIDHGGRYPDALDVLWTPDEDGLTYLDLERAPLDPWGNPYLYERPANGRERMRVVSLGADGKPGGEGENGDVDNLR